MMTSDQLRRELFGAQRGVFDLFNLRPRLGWLIDYWCRCLSPALFLQYESALKRPGQLQASGLKLTKVDQILAALASAAEPVTPGDRPD